MKPIRRIRGAVALAAALLTAALFPAVCVHAENVPPGAVSSVTADGVTTYYYDTQVSGGMSAMWNDAVSARNATIKLYTDWNPQKGTQLVVGGKGAAFEGVICVPTGHQITLDLNGHAINRGLTAALENGEVIVIENRATLNLTDTMASSGGQGKITGGFSTGTAGGIEVEPGGTLNLWGGSITGNQTDAFGGGIRLAGEGAKLYMTGGSIKGNSAGAQGGGVYMLDADAEIVEGSFTENHAQDEGGAFLVNGGTLVLQSGDISSNDAAAGGGITTQGTADLTVKGSFTIQNNVAAANSGYGSTGGGIHALGSLPVRLSGSPTISGNRLSNGKASNLSFLVDETTAAFVGPRIVDDGVTDSARIGVGFGGEGYFDIRELGFAPTWGKAVFAADDDFEYIEADGVMYLRRAAVLSDYYLILAIGGGVILVLIIVVIILCIIGAKQKKKRKKRRKKGKPASGSKPKPRA